MLSTFCEVGGGFSILKERRFSSRFNDISSVYVHFLKMKQIYEKTCLGIYGSCSVTIATMSVQSNL